MTPPQGLFSSSKGVCKLKRSLYCLKQVPIAWYEKFHSTLLGFSFTQSQYDSSLFIHSTPTRIVLLLLCGWLVARLKSQKAILGCLVLSQLDDDIVRFPTQNQFYVKFLFQAFENRFLQLQVCLPSKSRFCP